MDEAHAASKLREKGNNYFSRSEFEAAIRAYDQALEYSPSDPVLFSNKAACYLKLKNLDLTIECANKCISIDPKYFKAYCHKAQALEQRDELSEADKLYEKGLVLAKEKNASKQFITNVQNNILNVRRRIFEQNLIVETQTRNELQAYVVEAISKQSNDQSDDHMIKMLQLEHLFAEYDRMKKPKEAPDYFCCKITFDVMRDPVTTASGITYERVAIEEHLAKNAFDPVTRAPCKISDLRPNLALREAIEEFLKENPFA